MIHAIIVAGGMGTRMNNAVPKQFIELHGKPILYHTMQAFIKQFPDIALIVVLPKEHYSYINHILTLLKPTINITLVTGGANRFQSVKNGLEAIKSAEGIVFIHDAVRPFISSTLLQNCYDSALKNGNAIPCIDIKDSLRIVDDNTNKPVDRSQFKSIQTPQTFYVKDIKQAYLHATHDSFTDDATVLEANGHAVHLINGDERNFKITTPVDLLFAEQISKDF
jgi:2-C-methyl-D-erythritol 4-phosphate cytidylyltransferase